METDGGGWTVVQRRRDVLPREDFYRTWEEYVEGFGNVSSGEFWFGLDAIHALTAMGPTELRIDLADFEGESRFAEYSSFSVGDKDDFYRLTVAGYSGTAGDALSPHNGKRFTTIDRDFDDNAGNCAQMYKGAWWHHNCHTTNLNGRYLAGSTSYFGQGVTWAIWRGNKYSLKNASMMIRPAA
nr:ficolin-2-like [Penaeus vannamei]